jgi:hypothetical protein
MQAKEQFLSENHCRNRVETKLSQRNVVWDDSEPGLLA